MTPSSPAIRNLCYLPVYFGTDVPDLRLALHRIINNPRTSVDLLL